MLLPTPSRRVPTAVLLLAAGGASLGMGLLVPALGPLLVALALGAAVAATPWAGHARLAGHAPVTRVLLRSGVVLLGLRLPLGDVVDVGAGGLVVVVLTLATTFAVTTLAGRVLGVERGLTALVATGFSVCGAAAVAAVDDAVRARQRDVALAVALVTVHGTALVLLLPWTAGRLGLDDRQAAVWAGASIHEVGQVVAAAALLGPGALAVATAVKLARVLLLAPVYAVVARGTAAPDQPRGGPPVPWFVIGFALAVAVRSAGVLPTAVLDVADGATTVLLAAAMFGLGLGLRVRDLLPLPRGVLALSAVATATVTGTSLLLVLALV
ncbi:YeiH family protein [Aeromicrobium massiliense]|uniref:YeiH family protein n=1 Tax=Aeromicrobium massiliense TaxID=1464554 RepID=UPI0002DD7BBF|nr:putative sulfate exporter family transporter [Aeromicrobium massiliense]